MNQLPNPGPLLKNLRTALAGAAVTALGLFSSQPVNAATFTQSAPIPASTIMDRSRKAAKLVLSLPGHAFSLAAQHRSHASHASHSSHVSGASAPAAPRDPAPAAPVTQPTVTTPADNSDSSAATISSFIVGKITKVDPVRRTVTIQESEASATREFSYRDNTTFYSVTGVAQSLADVNERLPFKVADKVRVTWKSTGNRIYIATEIRQQR
jgi:hypothetical protein